MNKKVIYIKDNIKPALSFLDWLQIQKAKLNFKMSTFDSAQFYQIPEKLITEDLVRVAIKRSSVEGIFAFFQKMPKHLRNNKELIEAMFREMASSPRHRYVDPDSILDVNYIYSELSEKMKTPTVNKCMQDICANYISSTMYDSKDAWTTIYLDDEINWGYREERSYYKVPNISEERLEKEFQGMSAQDIFNQLAVERFNSIPDNVRPGVLWLLESYRSPFVDAIKNAVASLHAG